MERLLEAKEMAEAWCRGRSWLVRLPLLLFFAYVCVRGAQDNGYWSLVAPLNLGIHELGHMLFRPFGMFISVAGGSMLQCLVPVVAMGMFYRQRDFFAIAIAFCWLATNLFYVSWYMADARSMRIPLLSVGGGDVVHDWNYLLGTMGFSHLDHELATLVSVVGIVTMLIGLASGGWLLWRMMCREAGGGEDAC